MTNLVQFIEDSSAGRKYISGITSVHDDEVYDTSLWTLIPEDVYMFLKEQFVTKNGTKTKFYIDIDKETVANISDIKIDENIKNDESNLMVIINQYDKNMQEVLAAVSHMYPFKLYKYFNCFNVLLANGVYVTDENQEEKYFEVINTQNETLISNFTEFVSIKNTMNEEFTIFKDYNEYHSKLYLASSLEEAKQVYEEFMTLYK
jgi:hypothetical protein